MKLNKLIFLSLLTSIITLVACSSSNQENSFGFDLTITETENVKAAKEDLNLDEFEDSIEKANQETSELNNNLEFVDLFEGASYEAYLLTRAILSEESFKKAKEQGIFVSELDYEDYKSVSKGLVKRDEYQVIVGGNKEDHYGTYVAKSIQNITPEGNIS